ncbi:MAG TPA: efflux RND transporter periplasmic adaptor subunit [Candidatus Krumholzibacteriaceae bacterium]|nr:efflux RND transporter periplasmic adaptor subunit [Candidatus Krumholzibacteriaceae bacterium]
MTDSKGKKKIFIIVLAGVVVIALFAYRFWTLSADEEPSGISFIQEEEGMPVEVITAGRGAVEVWSTLTGTVEGMLQYPIVSTNTLEVVEVLKKENERVKAGELVIRLDRDAPNPMLHSYKRSKAVYENALSEAERMEALYNEGAVSKRELEKVQTSLEVARSDFENAASSVGLVASNPGIITSINVRKAEMAVSGKVLAWIARTDSVRVTFKAGSRQAESLEKGQKAVWKSNYNKDRIEGELTKLDLSADPRTHLVGGEAVFPNPSGRLIPGLLVSIEVQTVDKRDILNIPAECLIEGDDGYAVFVVEKSADDDARAGLRKVEVGVITSKAVEITSGITEGETVVIFGQSDLDDEDRVKIVRGGEDG